MGRRNPLPEVPSGVEKEPGTGARRAVQIGGKYVRARP